MICPKCGYQNSDDAGQCSHCNYKFQFGHNFNDPGHMMFISPGQSKKSKIAVMVFFSVMIVLLLLMIVSWLKSI
ncbi:hypothetical protein JW835_16700 [bacterium]|nr:hypothetical protein [bacterium]